MLHNKILTILNGDMKNGDSPFSRRISALAESLSTDYTVRYFRLADMQLHYCSGCFSCWWKTPGLCTFQDDAGQIFESYIHSDFVIFASPLYAGFTSSSLKKITDRLIVLLHPYITIIDGELHHMKRYQSYPDFGLVLEKECDTDDEDIAIINTIYDRFGLNFHARHRFTRWLENLSNEEVKHEIDHL